MSLPLALQIGEVATVQLAESESDRQHLIHISRLVLQALEGPGSVTQQMQYICGAADETDANEE